MQRYNVSLEFLLDDIRVWVQDLETGNSVVYAMTYDTWRNQAKRSLAFDKACEMIEDNFINQGGQCG